MARHRSFDPRKHTRDRSLSFASSRWWIEDDALRLRFSDGEREEWHVVLGVETDDLVGDARYTAERGRGEAVQAGVRAARISCAFE